MAAKVVQLENLRHDPTSGDPSPVSSAPSPANLLHAASTDASRVRTLERALANRDQQLAQARADLRGASGLASAMAATARVMLYRRSVRV